MNQGLQREAQAASLGKGVESRWKLRSSLVIMENEESFSMSSVSWENLYMIQSKFKDLRVLMIEDRRS